MYEERVIHSEKGSFTPLVFTTSGGAAPLCKHFIKKVASRIAVNKNEKYEDVVFHLRVRLRFAILRCILMALRGQRGKHMKGVESISDTSFNLIPDAYSHKDQN